MSATAPRNKKLPNCFILDADFGVAVAATILDSLLEVNSASCFCTVTSIADDDAAGDADDDDCDCDGEEPAVTGGAEFCDPATFSSSPIS